MRHLLIAAAIAVCLAAGNADAQEASFTDTKVAETIWGCLSVGLPEDWEHAFVLIKLNEPGAVNGDVRYVVLRKGAEDKPEPFQPCDLSKPALTILEARQYLPEERRNWNGARIAFHRNGNFEFNYDYPN
jgi:hypothetical protein